MHFMPSVFVINSCLSTVAHWYQCHSLGTEVLPSRSMEQKRFLRFM